MAKPSIFAHLTGAFSAKPAKAADDEDMCEKPVQKEGESDEDFQKRLKDWEESDEGKEAAKKAAAAEGPKDTTEDGPEKPDDKVKKAEQTGFANGLKAGNDRWQAVMASTAVVGRLATACTMLSETEMTGPQIVKALGAMPKETARSTLHERQAQQPTPAPAAEGPEAAVGPKAFAAKMSAVRDRVAGKTPAAA